MSDAQYQKDTGGSAANFIVNCRLASAQDVLRLIEEVKERVLQQFDIELELEIHLVGF